MAFVNLGQVVWPVGAIYMSSSSVSPASLFGGTWKKIDDDKFWLPSNTSLAYGGESTHKLTINEMPNHAHKHFMNAADEAPSASYWIPGNAFSGRCPVTGSNTMIGEYVGGGQAHNNLPPFRTCYCWYRTA